MLSGVPAVIAAGVDQVTAACCSKVMESDWVTLLEKLGLATTTETDPLADDEPPVASPATLTVSTAESLVLGARPVVRVHVLGVPAVQIQPPSASVMLVAVTPAGRETVSVVLAGKGTVELVLVTSTV